MILALDSLRFSFVALSESDDFPFFRNWLLLRELVRLWLASFFQFLFSLSRFFFSVRRRIFQGSKRPSNGSDRDPGFELDSSEAFSRVSDIVLYVLQICLASIGSLLLGLGFVGVHGRVSLEAVLRVIFWEQLYFVSLFLFCHSENFRSRRPIFNET